MIQSLKIAMYASINPDHTSGIHEHIFYLKKSLEDRGHRVSILYPEHAGAKVISVPLPHGECASVTLPTSGVQNIFDLIRYGGFDILHIHEPFTPFVAWDLMKETQIPKVMTFHSAWDNNSVASLLNPILPFFKNIYSPNTDGVIYVSNLIRKRWQCLCDDSVIQKVIFNGIDTSFVPPPKKRQSKTVSLLFLARLVPRKGLKYLLKAIKILVPQHPNIRLIVIGSGPEYRSTVQYVKKEKLTRYVQFKGEVRGKEKIQYYQKADIFCAPYWDEGFGITLLEAMATGCALTGFSNKGFSDMLRGYPSPNLFVEARDYIALARALKKLITDHELRQTLSSWGIRRSKKFSWLKAAAETEQLYQSVLYKYNPYAHVIFKEHYSRVSA